MADRRSPVDAAIADLEAAEQRLREAAAERDDAAQQLDQALAAVGWTRLLGAFSPGAEALYTHLGFPNATLHRHEVLQVIEQQRAALR